MTTLVEWIDVKGYDVTYKVEVDSLKSKFEEAFWELLRECRKHIRDETSWRLLHKEHLHVALAEHAQDSSRPSSW